MENHAVYFAELIVDHTHHLEYEKDLLVTLFKEYVPVDEILTRSINS